MMLLESLKRKHKVKTKLALFDLDGTLYDTRRVNFFSYKKALETVDCTLDYDYFSEYCNGKHYTFLPMIMKDISHMEEVHELKKSYYSEFLSETIENEHLFRMILCMKQEYYIGLVTTASRKNSEEILKYHNRLDLFDFIISQEDVEKKKPDPEGFVKAMQRYGINPEDTIIFEDSEVGIEAAEQSGATVFVVRGFA